VLRALLDDEGDGIVGWTESDGDGFCAMNFPSVWLCNGLVDYRSVFPPVRLEIGQFSCRKTICFVVMRFKQREKMGHLPIKFNAKFKFHVYLIQVKVFNTWYVHHRRDICGFLLLSSCLLKITELSLPLKSSILRLDDVNKLQKLNRLLIFYL